MQVDIRVDAAKRKRALERSGGGIVGADREGRDACSNGGFRAREGRGPPLRPGQDQPER